MPSTLTASPTHQRVAATTDSIPVPRRMPPVVFDALRAATSNGPAYVYADVRANVRHRIEADPGRAHGIPARMQLHIVWRAAFHDVLAQQTGRDPEQIATGGLALTHELARIATDVHLGQTSRDGKRAQRAVNTWLARAFAAQTN